MARQIRLEYPGAAYHVMARGNHGKPICADDRDRKRWLETLGEACEKTGWRVHAYVLMGNHYHLLLETPEANLVAGMKWLQGTYTQRYNSRHELFGHLFQGRYKALVIDGAQGNYFGVVSTYIHLNPARAGLIQPGREPLERYRWSSYPFYLQKRAGRPRWLVAERVLGNLGLAPQDRQGYAAYLEGRVLELGIQAGQQALAREWKAIRRGWYLGGEGFRARLLRQVKAALGGGRRSSYAGEAKRAHDEAQAQRWLEQGLAALGVEAGRLAREAKGMPEKQVLAWWLRQRTTVGRRWVSERLGMGEESAVTRAVGLVQDGEDAELEKLRKRLERALASEGQSQ